MHDHAFSSLNAVACEPTRLEDAIALEDWLRRAIGGDEILEFDLVDCERPCVALASM